MIRNSLRALVILAACLMIGGTWPLFALAAGVVLAAGAVWLFRSRLRLATPCVAAGVVLSFTGLAFALVAADHDTTTLSHNPMRHCQPGQVTC
jgi:multisubunit Na+/H+ antiporter MnhE subunit